MQQLMIMTIADTPISPVVTASLICTVYFGLHAGVARPAENMFPEFPDPSPAFPGRLQLIGRNEILP